MITVVLVIVVRGQICAAAKPCCRTALDVTKVRVHGGHVWILRVQHQRYARGKEARAVTGQPSGEGRLEFPVHLRDVHAAAFDERTISHHARQAAASARSPPSVAAKAAVRSAIRLDGLDTTADALLEFLHQHHDVVADGVSW